MVRGTIKAGTTDVGVKVNGLIAEIKGNEWIANNVPLTEGINIIEAVATDSYGNTDTETITIQSNDVNQAVTLSTNITSGIAPLTSYFSVSTDISNPIVSYQMDYEGDGTIDYIGATFEDINHTYMSEGIYFPTLTTTDNQGNTFSDTIAVTVLNDIEIDNRLEDKWISMTDSLKNSDITTALSFISSASKEAYQEMFNAIKNQLPSIMFTQKEFNCISVKNGIARYELVTEEGDKIYSYEIVFTNDINGLWMISEF